MTSWADIQKLASDLQRVQLTQSSKKLSEVNCIEVLQKLIASQQIDVVYTRDGHTYVTKKHLETEIKNECVAAGGRAPLTDIAVALNIDFDHIERTARLIVSSDDEFTLSNAELFATGYSLCRTKISISVNTCIASATNFALFSMNKSLLIEKLSSTDFEGVVDGDTIYTSSFLDARQLVLRAVLVALTKVTPISTIQKRVGLTPKRFWIAFENLQALGEVPGTLIGSRTSPACSYRPKMYDYLVKTCVTNQYRQNEFLQMSTLKTLGLDSKTALEEVLGASEVKKLVNLNSIYMSKELMEQCVQTVQGEARNITLNTDYIVFVPDDIQNSGIAEIRMSLQTLNLPLDTADEDLIGEKIASTEKDTNFSDGFVYNNSILTEALKSINTQIEAKAHQEVEKIDVEKKKQCGSKAPAKVQEDTDDWGDNKKGGKGGKKGGKGGKNGGGGGKGATSSVPTGSGTVQVNSEELEEWLRESQTVPEEILTVVVETLHQDATSALRKQVQEIQALQLVVNAANSKKSLSAIGDKCRQLYDSFNTFEAGTTSFADPLGTDLRQYLLKTVGVDLACAILSYAIGIDNVHQLKEKQRDETIESLPEMVREPIRALFASLKSTDEDAVEKFHDAVYDCSVPSATSLSLRKIDKKGRAEVGVKVSADLCDQLASQSDPATTLLLSVLYLFSQAGRPTTASGKFVAQLIAQMKDFCPTNTFELLQSCQKGVVTCIKNQDDDVAKEILSEDIEKLKSAVLQ
ncbi:Protein CBG00415 [Caenorhabditis briggsae]|uniref:E3 UFM1-protein ligase 1 homolog n=1 Tax=Caenorhabditis briggsae TaxID=6238 RepID=UFL1_CAEBR|nr:Protein CBG00415 [Caenorhabditis briggsae]A8WN14.4 RecName: Full=E3 UFM1-protein ligase 1 homolog; AltName: Full=E3 UFM1-protein transferase 1 homolog [Caenorhabditis briggsae]CAP21869.2 Protein CBG00415 [Caenorhabditis briggsae]